MTIDIRRIREAEDLLEVSRLAYDRGYLSGLEGNLSIRLSENRILSTAASTCKRRLERDDLVITDAAGTPIVVSDGKRPSTELAMHLKAYELRADVSAVLHAHPVTATALTISGISLSANIVPEIVCNLGFVPTAPYATPGTREVPQSIEPFLPDHDALMLDRHGSLTLGETIWDAFYKLEALEHYAQMLLYARLAGSPRELSSEDVTKLLNIRSIYGLQRPVRVEIDGRMVTSAEETS